MVAVRCSKKEPSVNRCRSRLLALSSLGMAACAVAGCGFTGPLPKAPALRGSSIALRAEGESVALVKINEETKMTTTGLIGGLVGFAFGGIWVGGALFAASSYLAREKDGDAAAALNGLSSIGLEAVNFLSTKNDEFEVTGKLGSAITEAIEKNPTATEAKSTVSDAVAAFDKEVGIKDTLGTFAMSSTELASQAVNKVIELNDQYKITDKIAEKITEATAKKPAASS